MVGPEIHDFPISWSTYYGFYTSNEVGNLNSRTGTRGEAIRDLVSKLWCCGFGYQQAPLVRTAKEFETERNSCPVLQPVFGFQLYRLLMNL